MHGFSAATRYQDPFKFLNKTNNPIKRKQAPKNGIAGKFFEGN